MTGVGFPRLFWYVNRKNQLILYKNKTILKYYGQVKKWVYNEFVLGYIIKFL